MKTRINLPTVTLHNNIEMPTVGLGVLKAKEGPEIEMAIHTALDSGYRMIDTASVYGNEAGVGQALKSSTTPRQDIFLTTKVWNSDQGYDATLRAFDRSLDRLGTDYVDLYLVHWPVAGKYRETWRALERLYEEGRTLAIGVSNFQIHHLESLRETAKITPMVNQIEMHPHLQQQELLTYANANDIRLEAWRPIMMGEVSQIPELVEIGQQYDKTPVQIALRWLLQQDVVVIPKSVNPGRIAQNIDLFDFELNATDMATIARLNRNRRLGPDPDNFNF